MKKRQLNMFLINQIALHSFQNIKTENHFKCLVITIGKYPSLF